MGIKLISPGGIDNYYCIGATVRVNDGTQNPAKVVDGGSGRASQQDLDLVFGLGDYEGTVDVSVSLPSGRELIYSSLPTGQYHTLNVNDGVDEATVELFREFNIIDESDTWVATWETDVLTDSATDAVTFSVNSGSIINLVDGLWTENPHTITGSEPIVQLANGKFKHTVRFEHIQCEQFRTITCDVESWCGDFKIAGSASMTVKMCLIRM